MSHEESAEQLHEGGCYCGAVRYEVRGPFSPVIACHCSQCRKTSGHYVAATRVPHSNFRLTKEDGLKWFRSSDTAKRAFCTNCGSSLFWQSDDRDSVGVFAGTIDGPTGVRIESHIFVEDAGDYYDVPATG